MKPKITFIDTACCLININGFKILTDPSLDSSGKLYHHGFGAFSKKISDPVFKEEELNDVQLILLSHPQHRDNFDNKGREFAKNVPFIFSTPQIERMYSNGVGMKPWDERFIELPDFTTLKITAVPAQHHPDWVPVFVTGKVIGFVLEHLESGEVMYISGDTVFFKGITQIARRFSKIDYALIHAGGTQFKGITRFGKWTMDASGFIQTIRHLNPKLTIPIHTEGWTHFTENNNDLKVELTLEAKEFQDKVLFLKKGEVVNVNRHIHEDKVVY